jgi:hypothetical protein
MVKTVLHALTVTAMLLVPVSGALAADEFSAAAVCRPMGQSPTTFYDENGISGNSSTASSEITCPLKRVVCAGPSCTYNVTVYGNDNNSATGTDNEIRCELRYQVQWSAGANYFGGYGSIDNFAGMTSLALSVTVNAAKDGYVLLYCKLGKNSSGGNNSYLNWISSSNF